MLSGRALAAAILGWSLVRVLAGHLRKRVPGLTLFHDNYGDDRLRALDASERAALSRFSGCLSCGRCDLGEGERMQASDGAYPGLMQLVVASSRSMPDFDAAARGFAFVPEGVLEQKVGACPVRLPLPELARFVRAHAASTAAPPALTA